MYANIELSKDGKYHGTEYTKGDVLRLPSDVAARFLRTGSATAYSGQKKPKNQKELEAETPASA